MTTGHTHSESINSNSSTTFDGDFTLGTSTANTLTFNQFDGEVTIESFEFKTTEDGNFIEVVKREKPNPYITLTVYPPIEPVDRVYKEIYGVMSEDGLPTLKLIRTIEGNVTPGHYVDESVDFDE